MLRSRTRSSRFFEPVYPVYGKPWLSLWSNMVFGLAQLAMAAMVWLLPTMDLALLSSGIVVTNLIYTGNEQIAWQYFEMVWPPKRQGKELFLRDFKAQLADSYYGKRER